MEVRPEYLSTLLRVASNSDDGEIHWGYVVVSCESSMQESICDIRSSRFSKQSNNTQNNYNWHTKRGMPFSPTLHSLDNSQPTTNMQYLLSSKKIKNHTTVSSEIAEEILVKTLPSKERLVSTRDDGPEEGVYFTKDTLDFGVVGVGSLKRFISSVWNC